MLGRQLAPFKKHCTPSANRELRYRAHTTPSHRQSGPSQGLMGTDPYLVCLPSDKA